MSEDPIGFNAGDANLYRYVGNGVTISIDPLGRQQIPIDATIGKPKPPNAPPAGQTTSFPNGPSIGTQITLTMISRIERANAKRNAKERLKVISDRNGEMKKTLGPDMDFVYDGIFEDLVKGDYDDKFWKRERVVVRNAKSANQNGKWEMTTYRTADAGWWLSTTSDVSVIVDFSAKRDVISGDLEVKNVRAIWFWHDSIDAKDFDSKESLATNIVESFLWGQIVEPTTNVDFDVVVSWVDELPGVRTIDPRDGE